MMGLTVTIIAGGAMGSALSKRLARHGATVLTSLEGRSETSRARSEAASMRHVSDAEILERSDFLFSIVPPAEAKALAERFSEPLRKAAHRPIFVDCNAVGVADVVEMEGLLTATGTALVDGAIIGFPPGEEDPGPTFYFCGPDARKLEILSDFGLKVVTIDGPIGAASALKLSYAGITKGLVAIAAGMILAAERAGAGSALKRELEASQPQLLARFTKTLPDMYPKAYRWVDEMHAIANFIGDEYPEHIIFKGAASFYERIATDVAGNCGDSVKIDSFLSQKPE